jgi:hypothetical protein
MIRHYLANGLDFSALAGMTGIQSALFSSNKNQPDPEFPLQFTENRNDNFHGGNQHQGIGYALASAV